MGEAEGADSIFAAINDIRVYADGIDVALKENKFKEAEEYVNDIRLRLDTIAGYLESKRQ